ncbi:ATP-binding protein [Conexibacter sp. JD483]|uniref:ATP-binding protein n=1 Tax=unclassified Conexibacter TaxID=2627773 RepID=UPI002726ECE6|nr:MULTISPECIES: ATP-binding protein [unclassified Conexibacter]MDO8184673.1 ATP-binding protein [Conexibacter sp. CPCC 205706]MDO8197979.1 ATP-binding protein [Conexibacter sp. CPCC 205762]MDR9368409.1 ATP-binding protein [Conexibacter sp. JD483]
MSARHDGGRDLALAAAIFRVGEVVAVRGGKVQVLVDAQKNTPYLAYQGEMVRNVSVGSWLIIEKGFDRLVGVVEDEELRPRKDRPWETERALSLRLVGSLEGAGFRVGVRDFPLIGSEAFLPSRDQRIALYSFVKRVERAGYSDEPVTVGTMADDSGEEIRIGVNALLANHTGIFGNTGSGKSYTLVKLLHEVFSDWHAAPGFQASRFVVLDFNGEYVSWPDRDTGELIEPITAEAGVTRITLGGGTGGDRIRVSDDYLHTAEFWEVLLDATEKTQAPFLKRTLASDYLTNKTSGMGFVEEIRRIVGTAIRASSNSIDQGFFADLVQGLRDLVGEKAFSNFGEALAVANRIGHSARGDTFTLDGDYGDNSERAKVMAEKIVSNLRQDGPGPVSGVARIVRMFYLSYWGQTAMGWIQQNHIKPLITRLATRRTELEGVFASDDGGTDVGATSLTIVSLKDLRPELRKVVALLVAQEQYERQKRLVRGESSLHLIIDEAHNVLSWASAREAETWKDYRLEVFEEIVKEGRKFGTFLFLASQRPQDISQTILSQLHNYVLHRLMNERDIEAVRNAVAYADRATIEALPHLPTGTAVLAGQFTPFPVLVQFGAVPPQNLPNNETISLVKLWRTGRDGRTHQSASEPAVQNAPAAAVAVSETGFPSPADESRETQTSDDDIPF